MHLQQRRTCRTAAGCMRQPNFRRNISSGTRVARVQPAMKPLLVPLLSVASFGCFDNDGSGKVVREHRTAPMFDRVEVAGTFNVLIEIDDEPTVVVETDDNLQKHVTARVTGTTLRVEQDGDIDPTKLIVRIT